MEIKIKEISTELSAPDIYELFAAKDVIYLDSAKDPDRLGMYSFIGLNPFKKITYKEGIITEDDHVVAGDPFDALNKALKRYPINNTSKLPFIGGCIGYMAYDLVRDMENLPDLAEETLSIPTLYFVFYDNVIVIDHHRDRVYLTELCRMKSSISHLEGIEEIIKRGQKKALGEVTCLPQSLTSSFTKETYMDAVEAMRQFIRSGDIYIANMTHTFRGRSKRDSRDIYRSLRRVNPAPFAAYMPLDGFEVMSSSPERFVQIRNGKVETRPIKGTRPRGSMPDEDEANKRALEESEKDKSELLMVVDLERNDLSKVCRPYTVKVTELFEIESYATVHHLVATVEGQLQENQTAVDCMKACFPGGSITGTPKIRAMEVIESLEHHRRNLYTGCIGYFGFDGGADFNIVIRTIVKKEDELFIGVGGGITWESDPESEYIETLDKAKALFEALGIKEIEE